MSEHRTTVAWSRNGQEFVYERYSRQHEIRFDGGVRLAGNAAPSNIPQSVPPVPGVDPEQAFVAALSSCHMLWFLHLACRQKFVVDEYTDQAVGVLDRTWMSKVTLRPRVRFSGKTPGETEHRALHEAAHHACFIANSVKSDVTIEPEIA